MVANSSTFDSINLWNEFILDDTPKQNISFVSNPNKKSVAIISQIIFQTEVQSTEAIPDIPLLGLYSSQIDNSKLESITEESTLSGFSNHEFFTDFANLEVEGSM